MKDSVSFLRLLASFLTGGSVLLLGHSGQAWAQEVDRSHESRVEQVVAESKLPTIELTPGILYQVLLAEIAARRRQLDLSARIYSDLARSTRDPRIVQRAMEMATYALHSAAALEMARLWVEVDPASPLAHQMLAHFLLKLQRVDEAVRQLARFLALPVPVADKVDAGQDATLAARYDVVLRLLLSHPDRMLAQQQIEFLMTPYGDVPEAHLARAMASAHAGDDQHAIEALNRALILRSGWERAILIKSQLQQRKSTEQAAHTLRDFLEQHPESDQVRIAYARLLIEDQHYMLARQALLRLLERQPDHDEALYMAALLSLHLKEKDAAEQYLKHLLTKSSSYHDAARYHLGQIAEDKKQPQEALKWYEQVIGGEQYLPAMLRSAEILARQGRLDEGRTILRRAAGVVPEKRISFLIGEAHLLAERDQNDSAFRLLDEELTRQPDQPDLLYESALIAEKMDRIDILERNLRTLIRLKPEEARSYNALGYSFADRNLRLDEAQQLIDRALSISPNEAYIIDSKGWLLYRQNEHSRALVLLRQAFDINPDPEIAAHLGEVLWIGGDQEAARKIWREATRLDPDNRALINTIKRFIP